MSGVAPDGTVPAIVRRLPDGARFSPRRAIGHTKREDRMLIGLRTALYHVQDLDPDMTGVEPGTSHAAYWGVEKIEQCLEKILTLGTKLQRELQDVGGGVKIAAVTDPFGNVLGLIENPLVRVEEP
jgi:hypothetical protein